MDTTELYLRVFEAEFAEPIMRLPLEESRQIVQESLNLFEGKKQLAIKLQPAMSSLASGMETYSIAFTIRTTRDREMLKDAAMRVYEMSLKFNNAFIRVVSGIF
jgi:hypothetical protein